MGGGKKKGRKRKREGIKVEKCKRRKGKEKVNGKRTTDIQLGSLCLNH